MVTERLVEEQIGASQEQISVIKSWIFKHVAA